MTTTTFITKEKEDESRGINTKWYVNPADKHLPNRPESNTAQSS